MAEILIKHWCLYSKSYHQFKTIIIIITIKQGNHNTAILSIMCNILQPLLDIIIPIMTGIPEMKSDHLHQRCPERKTDVYMIGKHG